MGDNIDTVKENTESLIDASKEIGLEINVENKRTKYNNPSFASTSQRASYWTNNITTCFDLHLSHHQVLSYKEFQV
jgi:hypothetical protein